MVRGKKWKKSKLGHDHLPKGLRGYGQYNKRTKWPMAKLIEEQMAKDGIREGEVTIQPHKHGGGQSSIFLGLVTLIITFMIKNLRLTTGS